MDREQTADPGLPHADVFEATNQLARVPRVPDDILICIFATLKNHTPAESWTNRGAIELTHVCRRWRAIAMELPELWVDIFVGKKEKAERFLTLSQSLPISVLAELIETEPRDTAASILWSHMSRICDLTLKVGIPGASARECAGWWETFAYSAGLEPRRLTLKGFWFEGGVGYPGLFDHDASGTPMALVGVDCPSHRSLHIKGLTRLELEGGIVHLPCRAVLAALSGCSSLKSLTLRSLTGSITRGIDTKARSVALPELAELNIIHTPALVVPFLRRLDLPPTTKVSVALEDPAGYAALEGIRSAWRVLDRVRRIEAMIETRGKRGSTDCIFHFSLRDSPDWSFRLGLGLVPGPGGPHWPDFTNLCDARKVAELTVHDHARFMDDRDKWEGLLADMRGLRTLWACPASGSYAPAAERVLLDAVPDERLADALRALPLRVRCVYMRGSVIVVKTKMAEKERRSGSGAPADGSRDAAAA